MMVWLQVWTTLLHSLFAQAVLPWPGTSVPVTPPLTGMALWWAADFGSNCSGACTDGAQQSTWADKSPNGNNGNAHSVCGVNPIYHTNQINGKPAVTFNGNVASTATATCFNPTTSVDNKATTTMFLVLKLAATGGQEQIYASGNGVATKYSTATSSSKMNSLAQGSTAAIGSGTAASNTSWNQINCTYNSSTGAWAFRLNRASDGSGTQARSITANFSDLGITQSGGNISTFGGQIAEFILYTSVLSGADITTVETYLHNKYGL